MKSGAIMIAEERNRQIIEEGFTSNKDDLYVNQEMIDAAICYLVDPQHRDTEPFPWPWIEDWFKATAHLGKEGRIRELVKAGALIAAEIDRLQRIKL